MGLWIGEGLFVGWIKSGFGAASLLVIATAAMGNAVGQTVQFTTCAASGAEGPTQAECDAAYAGTPLEGDVVVSDGIQNWTVPATGTYRITAVGAQGASGDADYEGGLGARLQAELSLDSGTVLAVAVGQVGLDNECNGGGGGGSYVVDPADEPLLVAGGGGGTRASVLQNGCDASLTTFGVMGSGNQQTSECTVKDVDEGLGGIVSSNSWGSGGAGFLGDGAIDPSGGTTAALSWSSGMLGGGIGASAEGGFGGGGSGDGSCGGGGGGGYSGGDGGRVAGGGGSFAAASAANLVSEIAGLGDGSVTIEPLDTVAPAEPVAVPAISPFGIFLLSMLMLLIGTWLRMARRV